MSLAAIPRRVVVVIGAGGMGLATAQRLAPGRRLVLADYSKEALKIPTDILGGSGYEVHSHVVDVSDFNSVEKLAKESAILGVIDAIFHSAGVSPTMASSKRIYEVDLLGTANVIDAFLPVASPGTSLICVASSAGHVASLSPSLDRHLATAPRDELLQHKEIDPNAHPGLAYVMAKRGNHLRVQAAAHTWGIKGARLNTISPGIIRTAMGSLELEGESGAYMRSMTAFSGSLREGTPSDIASLTAFLAGPESSFITGNDVLVDGGATVGQRWKDANI